MDRDVLRKATEYAKENGLLSYDSFNAPMTDEELRICYRYGLICVGKDGEILWN